MNLKCNDFFEKSRKFSTELISGSGKSPPGPVQGRGLLPEGGSYRNKFLWNYFRGSYRNSGFWYRGTSACISGLQKGAGGKGPRQKTLKKCQKVFRHFSTIFAQGKKRQKSSKSVKTFFRHFSTFFARRHFSGPFWGALTVPPSFWFFGTWEHR